MDIRTSQERNEVSECCCPLPECEAPVLRKWVCEGSASSVGFWALDGEGDFVAPWVIYRKELETATWTQTETVGYFTFMWEGEPRTEIAWEASGSGTKVCIAEYERNYYGAGWVGAVAGDCFGNLPLPDAEASSTNSFAGTEESYIYHIDGIWLNGYYHASTTTLNGLPADDCDFAHHYDYERHPHPIPGPGSVAYDTTGPGSVSGGAWGAAVRTVDLGTGYTAWMDAAEAAVRAAISDLEALGFVDCPELLTLGGTPAVIKSPEPETGGTHVSVTVRADVGYSFCVPDAYVATGRTVWDMQWDVAAVTATWLAWYNGGMVGAEPTPVPERLGSHSWEWDGNPAAVCTPRTAWPEAPEGKTVEVFNMLVKCWRSARIGVAPTGHFILYPFEEAPPP